MRDGGRGTVVCAPVKDTSCTVIVHVETGDRRRQNLKPSAKAASFKSATLHWATAAPPPLCLLRVQRGAASTSAHNNNNASSHLFPIILLVSVRDNQSWSSKWNTYSRHGWTGSANWPPSSKHTVVTGNQNPTACLFCYSTYFTYTGPAPPCAPASSSSQFVDRMVLPR